MSDHNVFYTTEGLFVWGSNNYNQLGLGDNESRLIPTKLKFEHNVISIHCGYKHTIINTTEGLFVFGYNACGQLGLGDTKDRKEPTKLEFFQRNTYLALGKDLEIISIHCGSYYTIINTTDGLFVFGDNSLGQLGLGDNITRLTPTKLNFESNYLEILSIHCGQNHTIINTINGLFVFGFNNSGQLGLGDNMDRLEPTKLEFGHDIISIHCGAWHTIINTIDGLFVFGSNCFGQLGLGDLTDKLEPTKLDFFSKSGVLEIKSIHCGAYHTIVNTTNGLFVFGSNGFGRLGLGLDLGNNRNIREPTKLEFEHDVISIHCNITHTMIFTTDGLFVFGDNSSGQLGLGDNDDRYEPTNFKFEHEIISLRKRKQIKSARFKKY